MLRVPRQLAGVLLSYTLSVQERILELTRPEGCAQVFTAVRARS